MRYETLSCTHHMKHLSILTGGEDHLGLEAGLEVEAMSRHRAASATVRGMRTDVIASASDRDTGDPHWDGPAVSVSSLATRHLLLISSCCKTKALICLGSSTNMLSQTRPRFLFLAPPFSEETCKNSNLNEIARADVDRE